MADDMGIKVETLRVFNTGRLYTEDGQRIAWCRLTDGQTLFVDIDRGIAGTIEAVAEPKNDRELLSDYDHFRYTPASCYAAERQLNKAVDWDAASIKK